jgi:hypothetical protein
MSTREPGLFLRWTGIVGLNDGAWTKTPPIFVNDDFATRDKTHSWFFCFPTYKNVETLRFYFLGSLSLFRSFISPRSAIPDVSYTKPSTEEFYDADQTIYPIDIEHVSFFHDIGSLNSIIVACDKQGRLWTHGQYVKLHGNNELYSNPLGTGGIPASDSEQPFFYADTAPLVGDTLPEAAIDQTPEVDRRVIHNAVLNTGYERFLTGEDADNTGAPLQGLRVIKTGIGPAAQFTVRLGNEIILSPTFAGLMTSALTEDGRIFASGFPSYRFNVNPTDDTIALQDEVRQVFFRDCSRGDDANKWLDRFPHVQEPGSLVRNQFLRIEIFVKDYSHGSSMLLIDDNDALWWLGFDGVLNTSNEPVQMTGFVSSITLTGGGSGYTSDPVITITPQAQGDPSGGDEACKIEATLAGGVVTAIRITNPGRGYTTAPAITFNTPTGGTAATATCQLIPDDQKWSYVSVSQRGQHYCAITDDGVLYNWGQFAISNKPNATEFERCASPRKVDTPALSSVFVGFGGTSSSFPNGIAIGTDGTAYTWGPADVSGTGNIHYLPTAIAGGPYVHAGSGGTFALLVDEDGKLYGIGSGDVVGGLTATTPTEIETQATWTKVFCGQFGSILARDETPEQYAARIHQ